MDDDGSTFNPATGLPMLGAVDVGGNAYGTDLYADATDAGTGVVDSGDGFDQLPIWAKLVYFALLAASFAFVAALVLT